jgi:flagellar hook-associated protein 3 FlgL
MIAQINTAYDQMAQTQTELATGRQLNVPSDNPAGTAVVLDLQGQLAQKSAFTSTATDTQQWMQTTESAISGVNQVLTQARSLGVQAANGTLTQSDRQAIAANLQPLIQQGVNSANGTYAGHYVLSGTLTNTAAFSYNAGTGAVTYQGKNGQIQREVSPGQMMAINTTGGQALNPAFSAMTQLLQDVQSGSSTQISADLQTVDTAPSTLLVVGHLPWKEPFAPLEEWP